MDEAGILNWLKSQGSTDECEKLAHQISRTLSKVMGFTQMKQMVREAMEQGALGISTGLFYVPGSFTPTEEVIALSAVAAEYDGIYISHMREEAAEIIDSVNETIRIGVEADIPVQITHHKVIGAKNWGSSKDTLRLVDEARAEGIDVTIDQN